MNNPPAVWITQEQLAQLKGEVRADVLKSMSAAPVGVGAPGPGGFSKRAIGFGTCDCDLGPLAAGISTMLAAGSPRLALAKARGVPLAPSILNIRALFPDTATPIVPNVGSDRQIVQDEVVDTMVFRIQNESITANQNTFQPQSDFFYGFQSGLEATLDVQGAPRYTVAGTFTPLSTLADVATGASHRGGGWILTYQQQLLMSFRTTVVLPFAPIEVIATFVTWAPVSLAFQGANMSNREACSLLKTEFGIQLDDVYVQRVSAL
jgi:hypothetical protein